VKSVKDDTDKEGNKNIEQEEDKFFSLSKNIFSGEEI